MTHEKLITSVEILRGNSVLINFKDDTAIHLTLEQLLNFGAPRIIMAPDEDGFGQALRRAVERKQ